MWLGWWPRLDRAPVTSCTQHNEGLVRTLVPAIRSYAIDLPITSIAVRQEAAAHVVNNMLRDPYVEIFVKEAHMTWYYRSKALAASQQFWWRAAIPQTGRVLSVVAGQATGTLRPHDRMALRKHGFALPYVDSDR